MNNPATESQDSSIAVFKDHVHTPTTNDHPTSTSTPPNEPRRNLRPRQTTGGSLIEINLDGETEDKETPPKKIGKLYVCDDEACESKPTFTNKKDYYKHMRLHRKDFECEYDHCSKKFCDLPKLKRHYLVHTVSLQVVNLNREKNHLNVNSVKRNSHSTST